MVNYTIKDFDVCTVSSGIISARKREFSQYSWYSIIVTICYQITCENIMKILMYE